MSSISLQVSYRPLRIGWCIRKDDIAALRSTARWNFLCWGGVLNPFVVIDDAAHAQRIIETFKIDLLLPVKAEFILELQREKQKLSGAVLEGSAAAVNLTREDLFALLT